MSEKGFTDYKLFEKVKNDYMNKYKLRNLGVWNIYEITCEYNKQLREKAGLI